MYNLIKNIYIDLDSRLNTKYRSIIISNNVELLNSIEYVINSGKIIQIFNTLEDAISNDFFKIIDNLIYYNEKIIIYTNSETYIRFYSILLKTLFPNISLEKFIEFFLVFKVNYDYLLIFRDDKKIINNTKIVINKTLLDALFNKEEILCFELNNLIIKQINYLSLEWQIIRMRVFNLNTNSQNHIRNLLKKSVINSLFDVINNLTRFLYYKEDWSEIGLTDNNLLNSDSVFLACEKLIYINEFVSMYNKNKSEITNEWLKKALQEVSVVFGLIGHHFKADRLENMCYCFDLLEKEETAENCLEILNRLFMNRKMIYRLPGDINNSNYNENLIRYLLRLSKEEITMLAKGPLW